MVETEQLIENLGTIKETESIKLIKNTKGYGWELKILSLDIDKLAAVNNRMIETFGGMAD